MYAFGYLLRVRFVPDGAGSPFRSMFTDSHIKMAIRKRITHRVMRFFVCSLLCDRECLFHNAVIEADQFFYFNLNVGSGIV